MAFQGKVVLVTGASSGIGAATAIKFAKEGAQVSLVGRNQEKLKKVAKKCAKSLVLIADVSKDEDADRIVSATVSHFGKLDVLVNNAGIADWANIEQDDAITVFDRVMATHLRAPVLITNLALAHLVKTIGNIVNISSIAAVLTMHSCFSYCTSKAGLDHFTRSIALELAPKGVRVNTVNPGPVMTDIIQNTGGTVAQSNEFIGISKKSTPLKRMSEPEEVADVILFLASDKAKAITGSAFFTDNGMTLKVNMD